MAKPFLTREYKRVTAGDHTYGKPIVRGRGDITIGKYCSVASGVKLLALGDHHVEWTTTYPFHQIDCWRVKAEYPPGTKRNHDIVIGNDVWIGCYATILHGSVVHDGAVIGANAMVVGEVRPYAIVVGNPAREIKRRFDDETIKALLEIRWWDWPDETVKDNIELLLDEPDLERLWEVKESLSVGAPVRETR